MPESLQIDFLRRLRSFITVEFKREVKELSTMALPVVGSVFESCFVLAVALLLSV